eukprot:scaffold2280_cov430-Prasinococcus_capsulatus_cf.AAC.11
MGGVCVQDKEAGIAWGWAQLEYAEALSESRAAKVGWPENMAFRVAMMGIDGLLSARTTIARPPRHR